MKKNKFLLLALAAALAIALVFLAVANVGASRDRGAKKQLTLFTWDAMFPQEILDGFEAETGITVNYVNFDYDETMLTRLEAAGGGDYDLVIADDYIIETVIAQGLAQKLDKSRLSNYRNINPIYQKQFYDPADEYTVPYGAGVQTICYDPARVNIPISGYADLWSPALRDSVGLIENYRVINGMALKVLGQSYNTNDTGTIRSAGERLL
ncbi:MAG: extracellular solute-binding protein, partial [Spirochaetaceae bacterium]|nr:extracellular solute-binding protein [Spirochaetaceae bacterium]